MGARPRARSACRTTGRMPRRCAPRSPRPAAVLVQVGAVSRRRPSADCSRRVSVAIPGAGLLRQTRTSSCRSRPQRSQSFAMGPRRARASSGSPNPSSARCGAVGRVMERLAEPPLGGVHGVLLALWGAFSPQPRQRPTRASTTRSARHVARTALAWWARSMGRVRWRYFSHLLRRAGREARTGVQGDGAWGGGHCQERVRACGRGGGRTSDRARSSVSRRPARSRSSG